MRCLLAAEADKIQDFVFRSSRLRQVVGASQLLSRFCREGIEPLLQQHGGEVIVNDGGSFRIVFEGEEETQVRQRATAFGADLAELYRLGVGGSLSVAEPVLLSDDFQEANDKAGRNLHRAKEHRRGAVADPHMPYVAYCASCGIELADVHGLLRDEKSERERYLCRLCQDKAIERSENREDLLDEFLELVVGSQGDVTRFDWPEKGADDLATYDLSNRRYVAYLVADGNGMGSIFGRCNEEQIKRLSEQLPQAVRRSLAEPTRLLMGCLLDSGQWDVPALPLILGGDDVFVLLPAAYALDFARRFCLAFEREMAQVVQDLKLDVPPPTMSATVVICKSKYPYALAHQRGEALLKQTKQMSKRLAVQYDEHHSVVNFEVILGNRLAGQGGDNEEMLVRQSLRPYWVSYENATLSERAQEYSINLHALLSERLALKDVPNKRLHEIRRHFDDLPQVSLAAEADAELDEWRAKLKRPIQRSGYESKLNAAMQELGDRNKGHNWRWSNRGDNSFLAHGFLDLLQIWHFAQDLGKTPDDYEPQDGQ